MGLLDAIVEIAITPIKVVVAGVEITKQVVEDVIDELEN